MFKHLNKNNTLTEHNIKLLDTLISSTKNIIDKVLPIEYSPNPKKHLIKTIKNPVKHINKISNTLLAILDELRLQRKNNIEAINKTNILKKSKNKDIKLGSEKNSIFDKHKNNTGLVGRTALIGSITGVLIIAAIASIERTILLFSNATDKASKAFAKKYNDTVNMIRAFVVVLNQLPQYFAKFLEALTNIIGKGIKIILSKSFLFIIKHLTNIFEPLINIIQSINEFGAIFLNLLTKIPIIGSTIGKIFNIFSSLFKAISSGTNFLFKSLALLRNLPLEGIFKFGKLFGKASGILTIGIAIFDGIGRAFKTFKDGGNIGDILVSFIKGFADSFIDIIPMIGKILGFLIEKLFALIGLPGVGKFLNKSIVKLTQGIKVVLDSLVNIILSLVKGIIDIVLLPVKMIKFTIKIISKAVELIIKGIKAYIHFYINTVKTVFNFVKDGMILYANTILSVINYVIKLISKIPGLHFLENKTIPLFGKDNNKTSLVNQQQSNNIIPIVGVQNGANISKNSRELNNIMNIHNKNNQQNIVAATIQNNSSNISNTNNTTLMPVASPFNREPSKATF